MNYFDDHEDDGDQEPRTPPTCKRCGKTGLNWQHDGDTWVLHEGKYKVHQCDNARFVDDFEDVS